MDIAQSEIHASTKGLSLFQRYFYKWMYAGLLISDISALALALGMSILLREQFLGSAGVWVVYRSMLPVLLAIVILIYAFQGQYVLGGMNPVNELRSLSLGACLTFLLLTAFTFFMQTSLEYSRLIFLLTWVLALILVPTFRFTLRLAATRLKIWGEPVIVLGGGPTTRKVINYIANKSQLGWQPLAVIGVQPGARTMNSGQTAYFSAQSETQVREYLNLYKTNTIIVIQSDVPETWIKDIHKPSLQHIRKIVVIPTMGDVQSAIVKTHDIAGTLGLELQQNLLSPWGRLVKHAIDTLLSLLIGITILPIIGILALLIRLDSRGNAFYSQERIGYGGKPFTVWKFRTMVENADQILQEYLAKNPGLQAEWDETQKLKDDPRITRVGNVLRKLSLDELPQILNILRGEMSLIGPRPCMPEQMSLYGEITDLYQCVRPGITGLWQVSGRNNTTYEERVYFDGYYVQNWSMWLDIYILIKTIWVVISRDGAY